MDPIRDLLNLLQARFANASAQAPFSDLEAHVRTLFARFELVPKHEFEAHLQTLASLEAQVAELEAKLAQLNP